MSKICIVHGVGYTSESEVYASHIAEFARELARRTGVTSVELFPWQHPGQAPADPRGGWLFTYLREGLSTIIMDFAHVLYNLDTITKGLPQADMYIGHSAGGIIISVKTDKPQVTMGCPLQLIENVRLCSNGSNVLNLMHAKDPVAAPISGAENVVVRAPMFAGMLDPFSAHTSYWKSGEVMDQCVAWYDKKVLPGVQDLVTAHRILKNRAR